MQCFVASRLHFWVTAFVQPGMAPVYCVVHVSDSLELFRYCLIGLDHGGDHLHLMYPVFNNVNIIDPAEPYCSCSDPTGTGRSAGCSTFDFMLGLIAFDSEVHSTFAKFGDEALRRNVTLNYIINERAFDPLYLSLFNTSEVAGAALAEFCGAYCTMLSLFIGDTSRFAIREVSEYYFTLNNVSCVPSFTIPDSAWAALAANPPQPLLRPFFECYSSKWSNFQAAVGVSVGNTSLLMSIFSLLMIPLVFLTMKATGHAPPRIEYSKEEMEEASMALALQVEAQSLSLSLSLTLLSLLSTLSLYSRSSVHAHTSRTRNACHRHSPKN